MSIIAALLGAVAGWTTIALTAMWYWRVVVPELYVDQSVAPFVLTSALAALAYLAVLIGAVMRMRRADKGLAMALMVAGAVVIAGIVFGTLETGGMWLMPSFLVTSAAPALPVRGLPDV